MKRCDLTKDLVFFLTIIITLCCGLIPSSWALDDALCDCSVKSLKGCYVFSQSGSMIVPALSGPDPQPFAIVGIIRTDGKGGFSGNETGQLGEYTIKANFAGKYDLGEDCKGTASITVYTYEPDGLIPPLNMEIALATTKNGQEVHLLTTSISVVDIINDDIVPFMQPLAVVGTGISGADD